MNNEAMNNGWMRFRLWLKHRWLWVLALLLLVYVTHYWFAGMPFLTVDYWLTSISKGYNVIYEYHPQLDPSP